MVRQRNVPKSEKSVDKTFPKSSLSKKQNVKSARIKFEDVGEVSFTNKLTSVQTIITFSILTIAAYVCYQGYLETRVNTPYDDNKVVQLSGLSVPEKYWGTYRSGNYFGLKTREPYSPVVGLLWYFPLKIGPQGLNFRHWCEQGDNLNRYTWTHHDGQDFGIQEIDDGNVRLTTSFVKRPGGHHGGDWTARINISSLEQSGEGEQISLIFYSAMEAQTLGQLRINRGSTITGFEGNTDKLGNFKIQLVKILGNIKSESYLVTEGYGLHLLKEVILGNLKLVNRQGKGKDIVLAGDVTQSSAGNITATQITVQVPFVIDITYESGSVNDRQNSLTAESYDQALNEKINSFNNKFENIFKLKEKGFEEEDIKFAKSAFSNLLGRIGYFYGASRVRSEHTENPVPYWKAPLYTAVPSCSFFPRGFLWDEGFHGLLISSWDLGIELDIMGHWFDLMNVEGWIPREQILGAEALAKVPEEFVTQVNTNANPPTFFLTIQFMLKNYGEKLKQEKNTITLNRMYSRLVKWFDWFNTTQVGTLPGTYRWRGRDSKTNRELNPKTLTSGLDDYPRASHPTDDERHIDLRCWIALGAKTLADLATYLGRPSDKYLETYKYLADNKLLDYLHWSYGSDSYSDYGLHTDSVILKKPKPQKQPHGPPKVLEMHRVVTGSPSLQFVDTTFGYVSLFPFFLQLIDANSPKLQKVLTDLEKPQYLWTDYGLRSLATTSPLYMAYNTEHDAPYWRGPIWININYLAIRSLFHYSKVPGPYSDIAAKLYVKLRTNIIRNIYQEYKRTGYIWEQYNDKTGKGQGSHPFTGWSSLVVLIMGEIY